MTNNISFKAQFIKPVYIKRVIDKGNSKCLASFVELNQANINDVKTIELLNKEWGDKAKYLKNIYRIRMCEPSTSASAMMIILP